MGAINFKTGEYITLAIKPYDAAEVLADPDFMEYLREIGETEHAEEIAADEIWRYYEADAENIESIFKKYSFEFFNIEILAGYYESIQLYITNNLPVYFYDAAEKREALKEVTKVKEFLTEAAGVGFTACAPSWCTAYYNRVETLQKIKEAAAAMREEIRTAETWRTHKRKTA